MRAEEDETMTMMTDDDTEVRRAKRSWPAQYKLDILTEIEQVKASGGISVAEILRREGLYSSLITDWRKQRDNGALEGLTSRKSGRPSKDPARTALAKARAENEALRAELDTAQELIQAQGKVSALLQEMSRKSAAPNTKQP
jgi:transposase-like protein